MQDKHVAEPTARILLGYRNRQWTVAGALAELVDNSYGENRGAARNVWITYDKPHLMVLDDGVGMTPNTSPLFVLGEGIEVLGGRDTGFYGMGGSEGLLWLGDKVHVYTLRDGAVSHGNANWKWCVQQRRFPSIDHAWELASVANCPTELLTLEHGTAILIELKSGLGRWRTDIVQDRLSRLYGAGLRQDRRLIWISRGVSTQLHAWTPGPLSSVIDADVVVGEGLTAHVHAGYAEGLSVENSRLSIEYVYRQVEWSADGFGRKVQGAVGTVTLGQEWLPFLTTTKDGFNDEDLRSELMEKLAAATAPLVEQLRKAKLVKTLSNVRISLQRKVENGIKAAIEGRGERGETEPRELNPDAPGEEKPEKREHQEPKHEDQLVAEVTVESTTLHDLGGKLCEVSLDGGFMVASVAGGNEHGEDAHPRIVEALESEPVNQHLLEDVLVNALGIEMLKEEALVSIGLFSKAEHDALVERFDGNVLEMLPHVVRRLTDGLMEGDAA